MLEDNGFQQRIQKIEGLVRKIESMSDASARASALELFQSVMELHGAGLERMMSIAFDAGDEGRRIIENFGGDDLVSSLLLLYGLHPLNLEERVSATLDKLRPMLRSQGGSVQLLGIEDGTVRLRLEGGSGGCGSSAQTLKLAVEQAIYDAAPDLTALHVESVAGQPAPSALVQLKMATAKTAPPRPANNGVGWEEGGLTAINTELS